MNNGRLYVIALVVLCIGLSVTAASQTPPEELDKLLAPIALYPDSLAVQILTCATSPYQVNQVNQWLKANPDLQGTAAQDAAMAQGFDASFVALALFPQVLDMMATQPDWTKQLGQAFTTERTAVFESIQRLRKQAQEMGNLVTTPQQTVQSQTTSSGQEVIVIEPANPQIIYVPQYNPQVIYTQPATTTVVVQDDHSDAVAAGLFAFTAGVIVGAAVDDDHYYYGGWGWRGGACYEEAWEDYYDHRENMAQDYYEHRENMAAGRQETSTERQANRTEATTERQSTRAETSTANQSQRQATRSETSTANQAQRQSGVSQAQSSAQASRQSASQSLSTRGYAQGAPQTAQSATRSSAFSGYQQGNAERASAARGQTSISRSASVQAPSRASGGARRRN